MPHPHQSTIDLLRRMCARLPPRFPRELGRYMAARVEELARDAAVTSEQLQRVIAEFGMYTWHYRKAFEEEVWQREAQPQYEAKFLEMLPGDLRLRVVADASSCGVPAADVMRLPNFERAYSPEEKLTIEEALLGSRHALAEDLRGRIETGAIPDYDRIVLRWKYARLDIEDLLLALRQIATEKPQWASEIADKITRYEEGMAGIAPEPTREEIQKEVENYARMA